MRVFGRAGDDADKGASYTLDQGLKETRKTGNELNSCCFYSVNVLLVYAVKGESIGK